MKTWDPLSSKAESRWSSFIPSMAWSEPQEKAEDASTIGSYELLIMGEKTEMSKPTLEV